MKVLLKLILSGWKNIFSFKLSRAFQRDKEVTFFLLLISRVAVFFTHLIAFFYLRILSLFQLVLFSRKQSLATREIMKSVSIIYTSHIPNLVIIIKPLSTCQYTHILTGHLIEF